MQQNWTENLPTVIWFIIGTGGVAGAILAIIKEGFLGFWPVLMGSYWGAQVWFDRLMSVTAAFFLLQNRARAVGMKSEVWVVIVIFTGGIGLLIMLAQTVYLEQKGSKKIR
jgi:hypothetical protein